MTDRQREETRAYSVTVIFRSGCEPYASENFEVHAADEFDAERRARDFATCSPMYNQRVPDFNITVIVAEPAEPDDDPPAPMAQPPNSLVSADSRRYMPMIAKDIPDGALRERC